MKPNTKKVSYLRELHETIIVRRPNPMRWFCADCGSSEDFLTLDEAAGFLRVGTREILSRIERSDIHSSDAPNGQMMVCAKSLARKENESTKTHEGNTKEILSCLKSPKATNNIA